MKYDKKFLQRGTPEAPIKLLSIFLILSLALMIGWLLSSLKFIFLPLILSLFITFFLNPIIEFQVKNKIPRSIAMIITLGLVILSGWLLANLITASFNSFQEGFPAYENKINLIIDKVKELKNKNFQFITIDSLKDGLKNISISSYVGSTFSFSFSLISYLLITLIFVLYFLPSFSHLPDKIARAFPGQKGRAICRSIDKIAKQVQSYILAKTFTSILTGLLVTLTCVLFKVDFSITWGFFAFFLNFIPTIGAILSCIPPIIICILQHDITSALWFTGALTIVMILTGNFLEPKILGRSVDLSPTAALLALFFWGWLWGGVGMIIAVPAMAMIKFTCDHIKDLKPIGVMLGN